eukprot:503824_1
MRKNKWREKRKQTDINSNPLQWDESKRRWKCLAVKSTVSNYNPKVQTNKIRIQGRYSVSFCKKVQGEENYASSKRNHSSISLSLINLKATADIGRINQIINVMNKIIKKDVLTSLKDGKLVYRKCSEIKDMFNKSSFPHKYKT